MANFVKRKLSNFILAHLKRAFLTLWKWDFDVNFYMSGNYCANIVACHKIDNYIMLKCVVDYQRELVTLLRVTEDERFMHNETFNLYYKSISGKMHLDCEDLHSFREFLEDFVCKISESKYVGRRKV